MDSNGFKEVEVGLEMPASFVQAHMAHVNGAPPSTLADNLQSSGVYNLRKLSQEHKRIIYLHVIEGMKQVEIANYLNITALKVNYTLNSPIARAEILKLEAIKNNAQMDVMEYLVELSRVAAFEQADILENSTDPKLRATVAQDVLDRTIGRRINVAEARVDQDMLARVKRMAKTSPHYTKDDDIEDVEVVDMNTLSLSHTS